MSKVVATYSPCCLIFRLGDAEEGVMHCALPHAKTVVRLVDADDYIELRKALLRYGQHDDDCCWHEAGPDTCNCGLDAALLA